MDSVTQFVLGAAVTRAVVGSRVGRGAALAGGLVATLPDLDVFVSLGGAVEDFTYHRSASHSLLVLSLAAPAIAWLVHRVQRPPGASYRRWWLAVWLTLVTHVLLDALTIYGTQLLWPLSEHPFGLGSVFIIDPLYTALLAAGVVAALAWHRRPRRAAVAVAAGLALSTAYLAFGVLARAHVHALSTASLERQGVEHRRLLVHAAPFTSLAWRVVAVSEERYHVAYHSLLAPAPELRLTAFPRSPSLLAPVNGRWAVERLRWFTHGFYTVDERDGAIHLTDLRMGIEPDRYAFSFEVARRQGDRILEAPVRRIPPRRFRDGDWRRVLALIGGAPSL